MRGHTGIIAMRQAGKRPGIVFLNDFPCQADWAEMGDHATVDVSGDSPMQLDLRFLVGMRVSITGSTEARAKALAEVCKQAGAAMVASCHVFFGPGRHESGWSDVWRKGVA